MTESIIGVLLAVGAGLLLQAGHWASGCGLVACALALVLLSD